jgi:hypothetical protein
MSVSVDGLPRYRSLQYQPAERRVPPTADRLSPGFNGVFASPGFNGVPYPRDNERYCYLPSSPCDNQHRMTN